MRDDLSLVATYDIWPGDRSCPFSDPHSQNGEQNKWKSWKLIFARKIADVLYSIHINTSNDLLKFCDSSWFTSRMLELLLVVQRVGMLPVNTPVQYR